MRTPTVCCGSTCRRGLTCPCTRKPSSTKWLGNSTNDHARLWDLQLQPNDLMLVLHRPLEPAQEMVTVVLVALTCSTPSDGPGRRHKRRPGCDLSCMLLTSLRSSFTRIPAAAADPHRTPRTSGLGRDATRIPAATAHTVPPDILGHGAVPWVLGS